MTPYWFPSQTRGGMMNEARLVLPIPPGTHWSDAKPMIYPQSSVEAAVPAVRVLPGKKPPGRRSLQAEQRRTITAGALRFVAPEVVKAKSEPARREPRKKAKNDPKLVAAARELRDRWLEEVNAGRYLPGAAGKYDVSRTLSEIEVSGQVIPCAPKHSSPLIERTQIAA